MKGYNHRKEQQKKQTVAITILILLFIVSMPAIFIGFKKIDCYNANRHINLIERCQTLNDCTLSKYELQRLEDYNRLQLISCPREH